MKVYLPYQKHLLTGRVEDLTLKHSWDAGFDLQTFGIIETPCHPDEIPFLIGNPFILQPHKTYKIYCGISVCIPQGYVGFVVSRSSARSKGITALSVWDAGYKGVLMPFISTSGYTVPVLYGERLVQLVITLKPEVVPYKANLDEIETTRGSQGVGSTGRL